MNYFGLTGPDGGPLVGFARLYVDCQLTGFFHWAVHLKEIRLEKPSVNVVVESDGALNFAVLTPKSTEEKPKTSASRPLYWILGTLAITNGEVTVTDRRQVTPAVMSFQDLDLELRTLTTLVDKHGTYSLEAGTANGETVAWEANSRWRRVTPRAKSLSAVFARLPCGGSCKTSSTWRNPKGH